jgi:PAT family beta-lactamase induction signal transducer AmpG
VLPLPASDKTFRITHQVMFRDFFTTIRTFFVKQNLVIVIAFLLLYRLPEALLVKVCPLFFLDDVANGGLGLDKSELGFVQGTIGVIGLLVGGILGGIAVSKVGLKKCLWPMAIAISVPDALYVMLAYWQSADIWVVSLAVFVEQLGYGFGFTAYMLYMIYVSRGNHQTSHYAFCTGFMALSMMIPGLFAGFLQEQLGYAHFFIIVTLLTAFTFLSISIIKIEDDYGKKTKK